MSDLLFDPHWWEQKFQFTDEQWQAIVQPLQSAKTKQEDRLTLELIARRHGRLRSEESFQFSRGKTRSRLERISKLAGKLREEILGDIETIFDLDLAYAKFMGEERFGQKRGFWPYLATLEELQQRAELVAKSLAGRNAKPGNVDFVRDNTLELLTQSYERMTGKPARVNVYSSGVNAGKSYGNVVDFMKAFMAAIPGESRSKSDEITPDKVKAFLSRRKHGEQPPTPV